MRDRGIDYFENSRRATLVHREYAIRNARGFDGYCHCCWGLTASDGPGPDIREIGGRQIRFHDYLARGALGRGRLPSVRPGRGAGDRESLPSHGPGNHLPLRLRGRLALSGRPPGPGD